MKYRIGLDISGGDYAPSSILRGAILASEEVKDQIVLIGVQEEIEAQLKKFKVRLDKFPIVHAPQKIEMADSPAISVRRKRESSIVVGVNLLKEKKIDAFVSCGNTGAVVCAATLSLGLIEGIERPGIALTIPRQDGGISLVVDVGANIDTKPLHLFQYGIMASVYYQFVLNKENPSIGLLNIGEEETKGPDYVKRVHKAFSESPLNFIGNIEAKDIFLGKCDCIVCDGFIGNVMLKVAEGCAKFVSKSFINAMKKNWLSKLALALLSKKQIDLIRKSVDYSEYGGAPLLGVNGIVIIGHGRSNGIAVKNAIKVAVEELERDLNLKIKRRVNEICQDSWVRQVFAPESSDK